VNVSGAGLNNTSGNWRIDNVVVSGIGKHNRQGDSPGPQHHWIFST
jgi:hypothetical protein